MGIVPVAPSSKRLLVDGESAVKGLRERSAAPRLRSNEMTYMPMLSTNRALAHWSAVRSPEITSMRFHKAPGCDMPQWGHLTACVLTSVRQPGHSCEVRC